MSDLVEIAITSDSSGASSTASAWDAKAGTNVMPYRGGGAASARSVAFIGNEFIVTANNSKPLLHIWPVNGQEQVGGARFVTPGRVSALDVTPDGNYVIAGIGESVYVWQLRSGQLLVVLARHYQTVTAVRCTSDGSHFVTAGQDGMVFVWSIGSVVGGVRNEQPEPLYSFSHHALPVSDVFVGPGGMLGYLVTVSLDRTCKVYDLASGQFLLNLVFDEALTACTLDNLDAKVYVGTVSGDIYEFSLQSPPRQKEYHMTSEDTQNRFAGHTGHVTCLSVSLDGETLMSGGNDGNVLLWHINSRQLVRTLAHKGPVTNAFFRIASPQMFDHDAKLTLIASNLKRMVDAEDADDHVIEVLVSEQIECGEPIDDLFLPRGARWSSAGDYDGRENGNDVVVPDKSSNGNGGGGKTTKALMAETAELRAQIQNLKRLNKELYTHSVRGVLKK